MSNLEMWEVFIQTKPGLSHKHAGTVQAATAEMALQNARDVYTRRMEGTSIWVVPSKYLVTSEGVDKEVFSILRMTNSIVTQLFTKSRMM